MATNTLDTENTEEIPESLTWEERIENGKTYLETNKNVSYTIVGVIVAAIAAFFLYRNTITQENIEAQSSMFQAVYYLERDSLDRALNGDGSNIGLLEIAESYGSTKAGNLAHFYCAIAYMKAAKYNEAIDALEAFQPSDLLLSARKEALIGDAHIELNDAQTAVVHYKKAGNINVNKVFTPKYLLKLANALEESGDFSEALQAYKQIQQKWDESPEFLEIEKHIARAEALSNN